MEIKLIIMALTLSLNLVNFETGSYNNLAQNPIILDMDFCTDVDDAVAVRMATTLDDMNVCTLMAVGLCTTPYDGSDVNIRAVHGILSSDGYGEVPIGKSHVTEPDTSPYWDVCSKYSITEPKVVDAVELYKEVLNKCYNKVTIVTTGYLTNIQYLLEDSEGYRLVRDKCERIVVTGGVFTTGRDNNFVHTPNAAQSVRYVEENCPVQIVYVPNDVGGSFAVGGMIQHLSEDDIISKALSAFGVQDGREAWDPTAMFIAAVPEEVSNFRYIPIKAEFAADGTNTFYEVSSSSQAVEQSIVKDEEGTTEENNSDVSDNSIKTVRPSDMFTYSNDMQVDRYEDQLPAITTEEKPMRLAVRFKDGVTVKQYRDMIEGIISYKYLK